MGIAHGRETTLLESELMTAVHRYEGTVNQVMGDGIMALFGAPLAHEDHAVRACYAALAMQEAMRHYSAEVRRTPRPAGMARASQSGWPRSAACPARLAVLRPACCRQGARPHPAGVGRRLVARGQPGAGRRWRGCHGKHHGKSGFIFPILPWLHYRRK